MPFAPARWEWSLPDPSKSFVRLYRRYATVFGNLVFGSLPAHFRSGATAFQFLPAKVLTASVAARAAMADGSVELGDCRPEYPFTLVIDRSDRGLCRARRRSILCATTRFRGDPGLRRIPETKR